MSERVGDALKTDNKFGGTALFFGRLVVVFGGSYPLENIGIFVRFERANVKNCHFQSRNFRTAVHQLYQTDSPLYLTLMLNLFICLIQNSLLISSSLRYLVIWLKAEEKCSNGWRTTENQKVSVLRKKKIVSCSKVWFRCLDASLQRPSGPCMRTARLFCLRALEGL